MSRKFIPNGDFDFVVMAEAFARTVLRDPGRYAVSETDAAALDEAVRGFRAALNKARSGGERSSVATRAKELVRGEAERIIRRLAQVIRVSPGVEPLAKAELNLRERPARPKQLPCPQEPPRLRFVRAIHEGGGRAPLHELSFSAADFRRRRPEGAVRLELFMDLIAPDEPVPAQRGPDQRWWYLRSFTRSPIVLAPPLARVPMRVVYWGRWAGTAGDVGPLSATAVGWIEGGIHACLPGGPELRLGQPQAPGLIELQDATPEQRDPRYVLAVLEAQVQTIAPAPALPDGMAERRRLEGPAEAA